MPIATIQQSPRDLEKTAARRRHHPSVRRRARRPRPDQVEAYFVHETGDENGARAGRLAANTNLDDTARDVAPHGREPDLRCASLAELAELTRRRWLHSRP